MDRLLGQWHGDYQLWLDPNQAPHSSNITAEGHWVAGEAYLLFRYQWFFNDEAREGVFLLGRNEEKVHATWGDTFHMAPLPMVCSGEINGDENTIQLLGSYGAGDQTWGWRTCFLFAQPQILVMEAFNISPQGEEDLALRATLNPTKLNHPA